jgi:predicted GIY-YIG superfamily endonuclease
MTTWYVYVMLSESTKRTHVGLTRDPRERLSAHDAGQSPYTSRHRPWTMQAVIAFPDEQRARRFERYLETGSGRAFLGRHLLPRDFPGTCR